MSKKVLITGASGFIGKHLVRDLLNNKFRIICLDLAFDTDFITQFMGKLEMITGNIMDAGLVRNVIINSSPDYVFHLAGSKSRTNPLQEFKVSHEINYLGTLNLFNALLESRNLKLVTILGTIEEYGNTKTPFSEISHELPNSAYGLSKLSATKLALIFNRQFNLPVCIMRPSIVFGPDQGKEMFIPALINTLLRLQPFRMTEGNQLRDFLFIDDLIDALIKGITSNELVGGVINIASGTSIKIKDIAMLIAEIINSKKHLKLGELPYRNSEIMDYTVDIGKASTLLQWNPKTNLSEGLRKTISFYKNTLFGEA